VIEAKERWHFEHSLNKFKVPIIRRADGEYLHPDARIGWFMWQERAKLDGTIGVPKPLTPVEEPILTREMFEAEMRRLNPEGQTPPPKSPDAG
jgi:hypothetical protein